MSTDLVTDFSVLVVEEKKDEAIEAKKEKAKEQIDDHTLSSVLAAQLLQRFVCDGKLDVQIPL